MTVHQGSNPLLNGSGDIALRGQARREEIGRACEVHFRLDRTEGHNGELDTLCGEAVALDFFSNPHSIARAWDGGVGHGRG